jgi:hypothetical protein
MTKAKDQTVPDAVANEIAAPLASTVDVATEEAAPTHVKLHVTPAAIIGKVRVIDADSGELIANVIEADAEAGKLERYVVEGGALVRDGDRFKTIAEDRAIRIEWATSRQKTSF